MAGNLTLVWVIQSTNQVEQRLYRKIDSGVEELIETLNATVTTYEDVGVLAAVSATVEYRVVSVGIYRGEETLQSSPVQTFTKTTIPPLTEAFVFGTADANVAITSVEPFYLEVKPINDPENLTVVNSVDVDGVHTVNHTVVTDIYSTELSLHNKNEPNKYAAMNISSSVGEVYAWSDFDWGDQPIGITFNKAGLTSVPNYKPKTTNLDDLFKDTPSLINDPRLAGWNVSDVTSMNSLFENSAYVGHENGGIEVWNVSAVTSMNRFAANSPNFNLNLSNWCVSGILTEPTDFKTGSGLVEENLPTWGTCPVQDVVVSIEGSAGVGVTETSQLTYTTDPVITAKTVKWNSENPNIATVSPTGLLTGVAVGRVMITVLINGRFSDIVEMTVS